MIYNTMRIAKIKDRKQMSDTASHNFRIRHQPNIDHTKSHLNQVLLNNLNIDTTKRNSFAEKFTELYENLGVKEKKNSVLATEIVISASPEFFSEKLDEDIDKWAQDQVKFIQKEFGDNCRLAVLHKDEKTPHLHFLISTEEKKIRTYKNRYGETKKESYVLNAKRWNPEFLKRLHDRHALHNSHWGLERGQKGSKAVHKPVKEYYKDLAEKEIELETAIQTAKGKTELLEKAKEYLKYARDTMNEQINHIVELIEIITNHELTPLEQDKVNQIADKTMKARKRRMGGVPPKPPR